MHAAFIGFGLGFLVALQLGPMSLFLVRSTLRGGWRVGLGLVGGAILIGLGLRTLHTAMRVRIGCEADEDVATPRRAFTTSVAGTASNPLTIASWAAIFAAADTTGTITSPAAAVLLVAGVAIGSLTWGSLLATGVTAARRTLGERAVGLADAVAGLGLVGFGGALAFAAVHDR
ncbi:MAG TPA: LysE family transporter [Solirubrobacteraceae bacterium]|jgi:putative LysE/RhtB family amino acid efflux pump|nr:LysE family transporter [Solirubrobacteraceae bacterium]